MNTRLLKAEREMKCDENDVLFQKLIHTISRTYSKSLVIQFMELA